MQLLYLREKQEEKWHVLRAHYLRRLSSRAVVGNDPHSFTVCTRLMIHQPENRTIRRIVVVSTNVVIFQHTATQWTVTISTNKTITTMPATAHQTAPLLRASLACFGA